MIIQSCTADMLHQDGHVIESCVLRRLPRNRTFSQTRIIFWKIRFTTLLREIEANDRMAKWASGQESFFGSSFCSPQIVGILFWSYTYMIIYTGVPRVTTPSSYDDSQIRRFWFWQLKVVIDKIMMYFLNIWADNRYTHISKDSTTTLSWISVLCTVFKI